MRHKPDAQDARDLVALALIIAFAAFLYHL
jgi:hypothetical protein